MLTRQTSASTASGGAGYEYERLDPAARAECHEAEAKLEFVARECSHVLASSPDFAQEHDRNELSEDNRDQRCLQASFGCLECMSEPLTTKQVSEVLDPDRRFECSIEPCHCSCSSLGCIGVTVQLSVIVLLVLYGLLAWQMDAGAGEVEDSDAAHSLIPPVPLGPMPSNESDSSNSSENESLESSLQPGSLAPMRPPPPMLWHEPAHEPWINGDFARQASVELSMPTEMPAQRLQRLFKHRRFVNSTAAGIINNLGNFSVHISLPPMKPPTPLTLLPPDGVPYVSPVAARLNARFRRNPWQVTWPADGTLADAGLLMKVTHGNGGGAVPPKLPWDQPSVHGMDGVCASMVFAEQHPANSAIPLFIGGSMGIILRPGTAKIICGKPNDSLGHCRYPHCPHKDQTWAGNSWMLNNCMWYGNETGDYMKRIRHQMGYNELILSINHWPDDIVEASWGDPLLPKPHVKFMPTNWTHPFQ